VIDGDDRHSLLAAAAAGTTLSREQIVSNAAVLLFGGIETTEGMIANSVLHLLERPDQLELARADPSRLGGAIEESLRLEPAAAVIDRYAATHAELDGVEIAPGQLVRLSIAGANRDPAVFAEPDRFDPTRENARRHLAFAQGPHVCVGVHLARLEASIGVARLIDTLSGLRLDPERPAAIRGLVFRKPPDLDVLWNV
jgi:cytochrome P450